ncbi:MAG TPA: hypothetical protein VFL14_10970 [Xanthomonadales bacterium]|nr:hypothetical protein [Xanthomonadales bacterium]
MNARALCLLALLTIAPAAAPQALKDLDFAALLPVETSGHIDQYFRRKGFESYRQGRVSGAREYFRYAAKFGDKTSQLALALLHRNGEGGPRDDAMAYAWLDLAAQRGYPSFLARREQVWNELDEAQRERAVDLTTELYATYGDRVAKKRFANHMRRYLRNSVWSHPSLHTGRLIVIDNYCGDAAGFRAPPGAGCRRDNDYVRPERFDMDVYWAEQDRLWMPQGKVEVLPLVPTRARR